MSAASRCEGVIVVVEDEEDARELLQEILEAMGHTVTTAEDGFCALQLLEKTPNVCLVVLDLFMPRMDGFEVLAEISKSPRLSALPLCVTTSSPDRAPPGLPCLPKPIDVNRLIALADEYCRKD